jgi:hypothetical protein
MKNHAHPALLPAGVTDYGDPPVKLLAFLRLFREGRFNENTVYFAIDDHKFVQHGCDGAKGQRGLEERRRLHKI